MNEIYVTGHRNPDTDSIVAAMSYAALKNALGEKEYVAVHLGTISDETNRMLERFHFKPPRCIQNVRTQVQDLDFDRPPCLDASVTMDRAWKLMRDQKISAIPVVNEDGTLYGMLSAGDIATFSLNTVGDPKVEEIPLFNLLSVIEGRIMGDGGELVDSVSGTVSIALPQNCENLLFDSADSIVLCGSQPDMIRRALDRQVDCLILCQTDVEPEWLENAGKTCVISTPLDASRVHRLIYQATPISRPCATDDLISFHMDDYIDDVREVVLKSRYRCYPVLDAEEKVVGTLSRYHLLRPRRKQVVLVDHNELAQTVPGIEQAEILGIIDHHRLADIQTRQPISVRNEPVGSTNTIITSMYQEHGVTPSPHMAGLMASAILSDTVMFKSPTCTKRDIAMAERLARIAKVSLKDLGRELFSGSNDSRVFCGRCVVDRFARHVENVGKTDYSVQKKFDRRFVCRIENRRHCPTRLKRAFCVCRHREIDFVGYEKPYVFRKIERRNTARYPFGIRERVTYGQFHSRLGDLRDYRTVVKLDHRMDYAVGLNYIVDVYGVEQPTRFYYFKPFVHHRRTVYRDLFAHRPVRVPYRLFRRDTAKFRSRSASERTSARGENYSP